MALLKIHHLPTSTRILLGCLGCISSILFLIKLQRYQSDTSGDLKFHDIRVSYIQLVPRYTIFYPWAVVTAIFAEISIISFIVSSAVLTVASKYIEKFWGYKEVIKFVFIVGTITNFFTVLVTILSNVARGDAVGMDRPLGGGISYYFGFLVVLKQLIPEHNISLFQGVINFRVKHLPFICISLCLVWSLIFSRSLYPFFPSIESFMVSFIYLRFFQAFAVDPILPVMSNDNSSIIHGDPSDVFKLVEFFPSATHGVLSNVFDKCYEVAVLLGIITPFNDESIEQGNFRAQKRLEQINQTQKSVANSVAERRRQVALQVIEDRMNKDSRA